MAYPTKYYFLYYCLKLMGKSFIPILFKITQKNVNKAITESLPIPLLPIEQQKQIAHILSVVDKKTEVEQKREEVFEEVT